MATPRLSICLRRLALGSLTNIFEAPNAAADQDHERADRPGPSDQHRAAAGHLGAIDAVKRDRSRFDERALLVGDVVRDQIGVVVVDDRELAHAAPGPAQSDAPHAWAQMVEAPAAVIVVERHDERLDRNSVAFSDPPHVAANVDNLRGKLMAKNLRQHRAGELVRSRGGDDRAACEFVQVRAADAASARFDEHLAVPERVRRPNVFDAYVLLGVEPHRFHCYLPLSVRRQRTMRRDQGDDAFSRAPA